MFLSTADRIRPHGSTGVDRGAESLVFQAACRRVTAAVSASRPNRPAKLLGKAADTAVYGGVRHLRRAGRLRSCCGHIESTVPLWQALDRAADRAATDDPRFPPIVASELGQLHVDVWILWGPEPVTARGEDRVAAVAIGKHGLQIARGHARGLLLPGVAVEHGFDARTFFEQVCHKAGLPADAWKDDDTKLKGFEGEAIEGPMQLDVETLGRRPWPAASIPATRVKCSEMLDELFAFDVAAAGASALGRARWCRTPAGSTRAGWPRPCSAGWRFPIRHHSLSETPAARRQLGRRAASAVAFPGGELASDPELAARLAEGVPGLELDAAAHRARARHRGAVAACWPGWPRGFAWWESRWAIRRCPSCSGSAWRMSVVLREMPATAVAGRFQRHEPFCRRSRDAPLGPAGVGFHRHARPGAGVRDGAPQRHQHVRHGPVRRGDGGAAVVRLAEPLRIGRLCHQCRCQRQTTASWATRGCCSSSRASVQGQIGHRHSLRRKVLFG